MDGCVSVLLFPFRLVWQLLTFVLGLLGTVLTIVISLVLMIVGVALIVTIIGSPVGVPVFLLGLFLLLRALF